MALPVRLICLQHVPFEGPAALAEWASSRAIAVTTVRLYAGDDLPVLEAGDCLAVLGGPMSVHDVEEHAWLAVEKAYLSEALRLATVRKQPVIGICLGAQLITEALGARVERMPHGQEIGWFPVQPHAELAISASGNASFADWANSLVENFTPLHWHGEQFSLPRQALPLLKSEACTQQGFVWNDCVLALQCHLEATPDSLEQLIQHSGDELSGRGWVQTAAALRAGQAHCSAANKQLFRLLDLLVRSESGF